jgi:hypothetical protein
MVPRAGCSSLADSCYIPPHQCFHTMRDLPQQPPLLTLFSICCLLCRICQLTIHLLMCANRLVSSTPLHWRFHLTLAFQLLSVTGAARDVLDMTRWPAEVAFTLPLVCPDWLTSRLTPCHTHGDKGARTPDLRLAKASLSQLSYVPVWE